MVIGNIVLNFINENIVSDGAVVNAAVSADKPADKQQQVAKESYDSRKSEQVMSRLRG